MTNVLPNLLIAGVPKAGTTSLFSYLSQHPQICPSAVKEVNYFTAVREGAALPPLADYAAQFVECGGEVYRMEASPGYAIGGAAVIDAIRRTLHRPHVVITLRNPTERLWSAYTFQVARGQMRGVSSFEEFVDACERSRVQGTDDVPGNLFAALSMGMYVEYLPKWLDVFGDDMRVVFAEQLSQRPLEVLAELCAWLDLDPNPLATFDLRPRNRTLKTQSVMLDRATYVAKRVSRPIRRVPAIRSVLTSVYETVASGQFHEALDDDVRRRVDERYRDANRQLAERLARCGYHRFPEWLT